MARKASRKRKAPPGCFWRGSTLWARIRINGRLYREGLSTDDVLVAEARAKEWRDRKIAEVKFGDGRKPYTVAVLEWSAHAKHNLRPSTLQRYVVSLGQLEPWLKPCFIDDIDKALVSSIVSGRRKDGATNATLRRDLTALSSVLKFHDREDNPALTWQQKLKERRDPIVLPEPVHIERVIRRAPANFAHMIRAAWLTGCREEELASAERSSLDHERRQLTVIGKGNKLRTIDLSPAAYSALQAIPVRLGGDWLFWHGKGDRYRNVSSRFRAIVKAAAADAEKERRPFREFRFHDLRHRYAVEFLKAGGSIYTLSQHLGHTSVKTTEIYLSYLSPEEATRSKFGDVGITKKSTRA